MNVTKLSAKYILLLKFIPMPPNNAHAMHCWLGEVLGWVASPMQCLLLSGTQAMCRTILMATNGPVKGGFHAGHAGKWLSYDDHVRIMTKAVVCWFLSDHSVETQVADDKLMSSQGVNEA
jgi:hypothetical protein